MHNLIKEHGNTGHGLSVIQADVGPCQQNLLNEVEYTLTKMNNGIPISQSN